MAIFRRGTAYLQAHLINLVCALALASLALTPSLVPRPTVFQGFLAGLWFMVGFQAGFALRIPWRMMARTFRRTRPRPETEPRDAPRRSKVRAPLIVTLAFLAYVIGYGALVVSWQNRVRELVEMPPVDGAGHIGFLVSMLATMGVLYGISRAIGAVRSSVARRVSTRSGSEGAARWASRATGLVAVVVLVVGLVGAGLAAVGTIYAARAADTLAGSVQPVLATRSGSAESALRWDQLGRQGRAFAGGGPSAGTIGQVTGGPAMEPVRVYAGLSAGQTAAARADLVVSELERTGGFERDVLLVATPTGSGWLEPQAIAALEYLYGGNTATAAMQYSFQPSWVPFLFSPNLAAESSSALFDAVYTRWKELPAEQRPRLAVYGLSLGAKGMQGSFENLGDLLARTDAALFTGPPSNSEPWRTLQADRDSGSPVWQPIYQAGREVRWQSKPGDFETLDGEWEQPRLGYLQHATDPITWLDPAIIYQRPEWLAGPAESGGRGADVSDSMRWIPAVTFLHLATDMVVSEAVPPSHGHNFGDVAVDGWAQVLPGHGRSDAQLASIQSVIAEIDTHDPIWE
ncbi:alpha/beta-hydrolase family protein [Arthrobacter sp. CAN_A2]|uniref:alpha/beta-hydrolase family protein n=1 Tax=Arthrobacter sp. CAN_A2 TaxID=2787718 RepID=UPI0018F02F77